MKSLAGEKESRVNPRSIVMLVEVMPKGQSRMVTGMWHGWMAEALDPNIRMAAAWISDQPLPEELVEVES